MNKAQLQTELSKSLNGPVAILAGGQSAERVISLRSGRAVQQAFERLNLPHRFVDTAEFDWLQQLNDCSMAFIALHGPGGEDGTVQGTLETRGFRYTGSSVLGSALAMDKLRTKQLWAGAGLATPKFAVLTSESDFAAVFAELGECIVKPTNEGSSIGMMRVSSEPELHQAWDVARRYGVTLAEQWITGAEYTVSIVGDEILPAIRLETDNRFYDFDAKYQSSSTRYHCPCGLSSEEEAELGELALAAFKAAGCEGWGRVDVMRDANGRFQLLEVNTIPGMTDHSLVPMAAKARGWDFDELVLRILEQAL
ncbi:D-alanine-D-alanine ligase [Litorivivens lipolytica]|uniref:D-alanine--D-alanine ligase n=1 Tax=Litorivivens lipolytica TaxID=1524264 RepID=A0A7W4Z6L6_9GAMM|nr:D-alanine--D-alanine ligase [Litorivivens lipolytica]MBB3047075.1 D-alanine-D-alanine ligase [Litorivivens lipolytica]